MELVPIPVTQYMMPDGRKVQKELHVAPGIAEIYHEHELSASMEMMSDGMVAVYITAPGWDEEDELIRICANSPTVPGLLSPPDGISALIEEAAQNIYNRFPGADDDGDDWDAERRENAAFAQDEDEYNRMGEDE
jgi:hypothetical protein